MNNLTASLTYRTAWSDHAARLHTESLTSQRVWATSINADNGVWLPLPTALLLAAKGVAELVVILDEE